MHAIILSLPARVHAPCTIRARTSHPENRRPWSARARDCLIIWGLLVGFRIDEPGIVLGNLRDSGGPMQVSGNVKADPIGYRIESRMPPRGPRLAQGLARLGQAQPDGSRLLVLQDAWWWKRRHG